MAFGSFAISLAAAVFAGMLLYQFIISPILFSSLRKIPSAHPLAGLTSLWILHIRYSSRELTTIHEAHARLGPVVRLAPNEVSVNCVKGGIQLVYAGGFEKHEWYPNAFENYGLRNMFSMLESKPHSIRKRMISNIYSKSYLHNSATLREISKTVVFDRFLPKLHEFAKAGRGAEMFLFFNSATFDFVTAYLYGLACASNMLQNQNAMERFLELYHRRGLAHRYFWIQELPRLTRYLQLLGISIVPKWVWAAHHQIEAMGMEYVLRAEGQLDSMVFPKSDISFDAVGDFPLVYAQLTKTMGNPSALQKQSPRDVERLRREIASELMDHLIAGFETSGITLTYLAHKLSQRPQLQSFLRRELLTLDPPLILDSDKNSSTITLPCSKSLDNLPLLEAIVKETLRLHAAIPGPQPRVTPPSGCMLGPEGKFGRIPGGVRISAQAWSMHRNAEVFPEPEAWNPERWLTQPGEDKERKETMNRWFWAFGSGGRMCVGRNLAVYQIKYITAALYTNFRTTIVDNEGIEQIDAYVAPPRSSKLVLNIEPW